MFVQEYSIPCPVETFEPLTRALNYMREVGFVQGHLSCPDGVCIIGAIVHTVESPFVRNECYNRLMRHTGPNIGLFNDTHSRAEVEAVMERAAYGA